MRLKRLALRAGIAGFLLLAAGSVAAVCLAVFLPWERYEKPLRKFLDRNLPVRVVFARPNLAWDRGLGVTLPEFRVLEKEAGEGNQEILAARRLVLRPSLVSLLRKELRLSLLLDSPRVNLSRALTAAEPGERGAPGTPPSTLSGMISLPAGLTLDRLELRVRDGILRDHGEIPETGAAPREIRNLRASFRIRDDLSFRCRVRNSLVAWTENGAVRWSASGKITGTLTGKIVSEKSVQAKGSFHLQGLDLRGPEKSLELPSAMEVSFSLPELTEKNLSAADLQVRGSGVSLRTSGALQWDDGRLGISLETPRMEISDFKPLLYFLPPGTEISGQCALSAESLSLQTGTGPFSFVSGESFHVRLPKEMVLRGFKARIDQGRVHLSSPKGMRLDLADVQAAVTQGSGRQWTGRVEADSAEIQRNAPTDRNTGKPTETGAGEKGGDRLPENKTPSFSGPFTLQWKWSEKEKASHAVVVADLTGGRAACGKVLDKPAGVPLQAGGRVRFEPEEIHVGRAFLQLGESEWSLTGGLKNPEAPLLDARLTSGTVSLDRLADFSPAAREHDVRGLLEIKDLHLTGSPGNFRETATLRLRVAGKALEYNRASVEQGYFQAVYGKQILTVSPLIIHPGQGRVEAAMTGDFSDTFPKRGRQQFYGTVKMENVNLNKIVTLARREYEGRVSGNLDANLAFRGSGLHWQEIRHSLEARARLVLKNFRILGDGGGKMLEELAPGDAPGVDPESVTREARRLLSGNNVSALVSLKNETLRVRNLAATYQGKVVEMDGTLDFSGRLRVDPGRLFLRNRMIPFRLECRVGRDRCVPSPDLKVMGKRAAQEMVQGLFTLSTGSRDVFKELLF